MTARRGEAAPCGAPAALARWGCRRGACTTQANAPASPSSMPAADSELAGPTPTPTPSPWRSPPRASAVRHLVLAGMTAAVLVAYLPRTALGPAASSIKRELGLSDLA